MSATATKFQQAIASTAGALITAVQWYLTYWLYYEMCWLTFFTVIVALAALVSVLHGTSIDGLPWLLFKVAVQAVPLEMIFINFEVKRKFQSSAYMVHKTQIW